MAGNDRLNRRQRRFVAAVLAAPTIEAAAKAARISERTAYRYLKDPAVRHALELALDDALGQVTRRAVDEMTPALHTLARIHRDRETPPAQRVSAARAILDAGPKLREAFDLAERVTALEEAAETKGQ
jgi:hypothetical protein